jgi:hypothetical protein
MYVDESGVTAGWAVERILMQMAVEIENAMVEREQLLEIAWNHQGIGLVEDHGVGQCSGLAVFDERKHPLAEISRWLGGYQHDWRDLRQ